MALNLSELKFVVDDSDLKRASDTIGNLVTNVGKLDKAARDAAQTEAVLAKAAKLNADANLQNAKAQDVRLKSTITADKADQQAAAAIERKTKATEKATESSAKNVGVLQRQKDILEFQTQGFSRGQSSILSYAKAAGLAAEDIGELGKVLETQRKLMGGDPFDKSLSGLKSLQNQYTELKEAMRQYIAGSNLTAKQTRELARDKERLIEKMKAEGASFSEIRQAVRARNAEYVKTATSYNKMVSAEDAVIKSRKEAVNATNYLTQADQKMAAALNTSNAAIDKAGTDSLVKYESALRKSGVSQDVATAKLATYKAQLTQVAGLEEKRRAQHLARALQPQFTDIAVSLYSGQAPLTVLLQQSGQMVDLFKLSGIEANNLGKVMREAFASMIPAIAEVAKGLTSLVFESFMSAGSAVTRFVGDVTGITAAMEIFKRFIVSGGEANFKYIASLDKISKTFSAVAATGIAAMIAGMILLGLEYKKIIQAEAELTNALATSGGALGISKTEAIAAAEGMASFGVGTLKAVAAITEIAKAGNIGKESIDLITKSAIDLEKTAGISIEETVKQFAKLQEEPAKALTEIAQKTGLVDKATLDYVYALEQQGDKTEAARVATLAFASANAQAAAETRDNWSPIEVLWNDIKSAIGSVKQEIYDLTTSNAVVGALRTVWETVAVVISEVWFTIKGVGKEIGGIGAQIAAVMQGDFSGAAEIGRQMKTDAASAAEEQKKYVDAILNRTNVEQKSFNQSKAQNSQYVKWRKENDQALDKSISKTDKYKAKELEMQKAVLAGTVSQIEADKALAGWKKIILGEEKTKSSPSENYFATLMREATNNTIAANTATQELTKSEQKLLEVRSDPRFEKLTATQKQDVISKYESAIAAEKQTALTEKLAEAEEHRLKLLGKSEGIGKQYYSDMQKLEEFAKVAGWSRSEVEGLTRAVFMATPAWKAYEKALEEVNSAARKFNEDSLASQAATLKENESLDHRLSLLGKTAEEQRALSIEYNRANKLREVDIKLAKQLREIEEKIAKAKKDGLPESDYQPLIDAQVQARKDAAEQEKVINREVAVQYAEDLQKEIDAIKNGISDSIVTALFEGGKAGSKKLRNLVVAELKKPVTMVVNAVVNTVLGNVIGNLTGGAAAGGTDSLLSTAGGIGNLLGGLGSFGSTVAGGIGSVVGSVFGVGAGNVALGTSLGLGASSSTAAALAAAQAGGAAGGAGAAGMGSFLSGAGAAMPYIGAAVALISLISGMDDSGTYHTGGAASYSVATGQRNSLGFRDNEEGLPSYNPNDNIDNQFGTGFGYVERSDQTISAMEQLSKALVDIFDGIAKTFGKTAGYEVAVAFADDTSKDGAWGAFGVRLQGVEILNWEDFRQSKWAPKEFGDGEEGYKQYLAAIAKDTRQVILDMDLPEWADKILTDLGESPSMEALSAAIQQIGVIKGVFDTMTNTLVELSGASDETLAALMTLSGGIEALSANATAYYQNFYSAEEQRANVQKQLAKSFKELGLSMIDIDAIDARQQFRDLVEAQDLTTESGRKAYAALLAIAGTFASVTTAAEEASAALDNAQQAWKDGVQSAYDILEAAINAQIEILNEQAGASEATISKLKGIFDLLKSAISDLYGEVASTAAMQAAQGYQVIRDAISTGSLPEQSTLSSAISAVRSGISGTDFVSQFDADKARLQFAADLNTLLGQTEEQLSTEELTLKAIKDQIAMLELTLANAKAQLDAINGVNSSVLSVADAIREFQNALIPPTTTNLKEPPMVSSGGGGGFSSGPGGVSTPLVSNIDQIKDYLNHISLEPVDIRTQMLTRGWTVEEIAAAAGVDVDFARGHIYKDLPAFADGGSYKGGMALVGEEGPELINFNRSGQVYTADQTASMLSGGDVVGAIASLENRVTDLGYALQAIAINTGKSSRVLERVTPDGDSILISGSVTVA